ncbi:MAG: PadR family transcriptional regulator [Candidatus Thermoplasmatota archaeon]|jgi:PadR family transcriptional regulator PadR|nr:PadR family transcriptional regulator [Candidatus Thermoplasmatota archaeon]MDP7266017.1 PadR family transcriptional regulator [Candidatus Thermoplasmatota archaeon]
MKEKEWGKEFKKGGIQLCVLALLSRERKYGFQIIKELKTGTDAYYTLKEGTLYPILHRLKKRGYLNSDWVVGEGSPPRNYYSITEKGNEALKAALIQWDLMIGGTKKLLEEYR